MPSPFLATRLAVLARKRLAAAKPTIVAVTGSMGKTTTRTAIGLALRARFEVRVPYKNYNNEIGVPLAILGEKSPGRNVWEWIKLFNRSRKASIPSHLVLEYGADHPGDLKYLATVAEPKIVVITGISPVHVEHYPNFEALIEEKASLGDKVTDGGAVFLNADDTLVRLMRSRYHSKVVMYGLHDGDWRAENIILTTALDEHFAPGETHCVLVADVVGPTGERARIQLRNCVSELVVLSAVAGCAVAVHLGIPLQEAATSLERNLEPVAGRLRPLPGVKGSLILDDTYNAAPASVMAGLQTLRKFTPVEEWDRRIAVLGDMAELGPLTEAEHRSVGRKVAEIADIFVAVGPQMNLAVEEAQKAGMAAEKIYWCKDSVEAGRYLDHVVKEGDVVFVKGSQSMRMERAVKDVMAEPLKAGELLVRQEEGWG